MQGVGYRNFTQLQAKKRGYLGSVENLSNGNVEIWIALPDYTKLGEFLELLWAGNGKMATSAFEVEIIQEANFKRVDSNEFVIIK